jgi:hypothetical protein
MISRILLGIIIAVLIPLDLILLIANQHRLSEIVSVFIIILNFITISLIIFGL